MIIGDGDVASALHAVDRKDLLFFASGVSNSQETREDEFIREKKLLLKQDDTKRLVYFGSLSIFYNDNRYAQHKREMEGMVKEMFPHHTIVRLGNIAWGTNPHTIINYFKNQKKKGKKLDIQETSRYVVEEEEFLHWIKMIPDWNCEMNIPGRWMTIKEIVKEYV